MMKTCSFLPKAMIALLLTVAFILLAACGSVEPPATDTVTESVGGTETTDTSSTADSQSEPAVSLSESESGADTVSASDSETDTETDTHTETVSTDDTGTETDMTESAGETDTGTEDVTETTDVTETASETETTGNDPQPFDPTHEPATVSFTGSYGKVSLMLVAMNFNPTLFACQFNLAQKVVDDFESRNAASAKGKSTVYSYGTESASFMIGVAYYDEAGKPMYYKVFAATYGTENGEDLCAPVRAKLNGCNEWTKRKLTGVCLSSAVALLEERGDTVTESDRARIVSGISLSDFFVDGDVVCFISAIDEIGNYVITKVPISQIDEWQNEKVIALTYDDGPAANTDFMLDLLEREGVKATFFVQGYRLGNETAAARLLRMKSLGCEIGNHSYDHQYFNRLSDEDVYFQINETNRLIKQITGDDCTLLRPPGGYEYSSTAADVMAEKYGIRMHIILWWVDSRDWEYNQKSTMTAEEKIQATVDTVMKELYNGADGHYMSGFIVLMHDIHAITYYASERIISSLKALGYRFVTVSELMGYDIDDGTVYDYSAFNYGRGITRRYK